MSATHIVEQGDTLAKIADQYGFADPQTIWKAPENAELRKLRESPNVLLPGDVIVIPDKAVKLAPSASGAAHRFVVKATPTKLRIRVLDLLGAPVKNGAAKLTIDGEAVELTTDGDGGFEVELPPGSKEGALSIGGADYELRIGHLDPIGERSGLLARLANLGYLDSGDDDVEDDDLAFAISLFQRAQKLPIDGKSEGSVIDKLKEIHGC